jgi:hypothetical protein
VVSQLLSSPLRWRMTYSRTGELWLSKGGAQDRFTVRELKDMMSGLPGVEGTSEAKTLFQIVFKISLSATFQSFPLHLKMEY